MDTNRTYGLLITPLPPQVVLREGMGEKPSAAEQTQRFLSGLAGPFPAIFVIADLDLALSGYLGIKRIKKQELVSFGKNCDPQGSRK